MGPTPSPSTPEKPRTKKKTKTKIHPLPHVCIAANLRPAPHACAADSLRLHRRSPHAAPPLPSARSSPAPPSPPLLTSRHACPPQPQPTSRVPDPVNPSLCLALAASLAGSPLSGRRRRLVSIEPHRPRVSTTPRRRLPAVRPPSIPRHLVSAATPLPPPQTHPDHVSLAAPV